MTSRSSKRSATSTAAASSSRPVARVMPIDDPMLAGFTNTVSPSSPRMSAKASDVPDSSRCSDRHRACGMPAASSTVFAITLSMHTADPSTPDPTNGTSSSSSSPCTVPSSPWGPCSTGNTTVGASVDSASRTACSQVVTGPSMLRASGNPEAGPPRSAAADSARCQRPSRSMPIGSISYRSTSSARTMLLAEMQLMSCSADWPPNSTTSRTRSGSAAACRMSLDRPVSLTAGVSHAGARRVRIPPCDSG